MAVLTDIIARLDSLLETSRYEDLGPNGLQVPGREEVELVVSGVSASAELISRASAAGADLLIVHHGLFWDFHPRALTPVLAGRLRALFAAGMSLAGYHLPLDAHAELGNNALIVDALGCDSREPFGAYRGQTIGFAGRFGGDGIASGELFERIARVADREPLVFDSGPERVHSVGVISGGATGEFAQAIAAGLDAYVTGEAAEWVMTESREAGVHFIAAGHYATETHGVRALGEFLADEFGVRHEFMDVPNPV